MSKEFNGSKLRSARVFQGLSLQELGQKISVSRQYLQQLENDLKVPNDEMKKILAETLDINIEFFHGKNVNPLTEDECHFRSSRSLTSVIKQQVIEHGNLFVKLTNYLDQELELPKVNFISDSLIKDANDIERIAERCRLNWGLGIKSPITNMTRVLENAGALITYFTDLSEKIDAFSMKRQRPLIIRNPMKISACRMRFDLAHECGHIIMHEGIKTGDYKSENEANHFASAFLLPRAAFYNEFSFLTLNRSISWNKLYELKLRWKVSVAAIIRRAYDLGMIDAVKYRSANIYLRTTGQSKEEKYDDSIILEAPEALKLAINTLFGDNINNLNNILTYLQVNIKFLQRIMGDVDSLEDYNINSVHLWDNVIKFPKNN